MRAALASLARTPTGLLLLVWASVLVVYLFGPIHYVESPRLSTWLFVSGCLVAFIIGASAATIPRPRGLVVTPRSTHPISGRRLDQVVRVAALVGLFGAACIVIDKAVLSGLDFSQGIAAARFERVEAVESGVAASLRRSPLLYVGYLTFTFSVAAFVIYLLKGDGLRRSTVWLAFMSLVGIFAYAYLYGGRTPLGLVVAMAIGAITVRTLSRQTPLPRGTTGRLLFVAFLLITGVYSEAILSDRLATSGASDLATVETRIETSNNATIAFDPSFRERSNVAEHESSGSTSTIEQFAMRIVVNLHYITHEVPTLDRALAHNGSLGPFYGAYQFNLVPAFVARVVPAWNLDAVMIPQLQAASVYGYWPTAWGGMYLDFGIGGALVAVLLCGWVAGRIYSRALLDGDDRARVLMCYVVAGILATPLLPIFAISISLLILMSLVVTGAFLHPAPRALPTGSGAAVPSGGSATAR
jgi:hypothetical protein